MSGGEYSRSDQSSLSMSFRRFLLQWPSPGEPRIARTARRRRGIVICALMLGSLQLSPATSQSLVQPPESNSTVAKEPITPIPEPPAIDPLKIKLGERLFGDPRLSHDNSRSCSSCHDLRTNGASLKSQDVGIDGSSLPLNTPTIFNADALVSFERTLVTPGSRFDRWLAGDVAALSMEELDGYRLFKSLGCASCHQGVNIGGNLFERHGVFHPLASPKPEILRVPSLRNVATTPPYFHDGSAQTLDDAVRKMGLAQLNSTLTDQQVQAIVAYLQTLTGDYRGTPVGASP